MFKRPNKKFFNEPAPAFSAKKGFGSLDIGKKRHDIFVAVSDDNYRQPQSIAETKDDYEYPVNRPSNGQHQELGRYKKGPDAFPTHDDKISMWTMLAIYETNKM